MSILKAANEKTLHAFEVCVIKTQMGLELEHKDITNLIQMVFTHDAELVLMAEEVKDLKFKNTNVHNKLNYLRTEKDACDKDIKELKRRLKKNNAI